MIRYIIEKVICNDYAHGVMTLTENDKPKTFTSKELAAKYLSDLNIPKKDIAEFYNIKPFIT